MRALLLLAASVGLAHAESRAVLTGYVGDPLGEPVASATVLVIGPAGLEHQATTGPDGRYRVALDGAGTYHVVFVANRSHDRRTVEVTPGATVTADGDVDPSTGEVIEIHDRPPPPVIARSTRRPIPPPYSDTAVLQDTWTRAWLLLDIDERGRVTRFKFLKRPGADLERIAQRVAFETRFEPARDGAGRAIRSRLVWALEWPSHDWMRYRTGTATSVVPSMGYVPCAGSGPWNMDMGNRLGPPSPKYRDCSTPKLETAYRERWVTAGSTR